MLGFTLEVAKWVQRLLGAKDERFGKWSRIANRGVSISVKEKKKMQEPGQDFFQVKYLIY